MSEIQRSPFRWILLLKRCMHSTPSAFSISPTLSILASKRMTYSLRRPIFVCMPPNGANDTAPIAAAFPGAAFVGVSSIHRTGKVYLDPSAITGAASRACRFEDAVSLDRNRLEFL
jgi:hypothetical protein